MLMKFNLFEKIINKEFKILNHIEKIFEKSKKYTILVIEM